MSFLTEIFYQGTALDMYAERSLRYTIQANDIAELKDRQASHSNSYSLPKTPKNVRILGGLGIASDTSREPYNKPAVQLKIDGFDFVVKGWITIKETDDEYKIAIYSGVIEFFKAIENKTLGGDLDLSEINHTKNLATVLASFTNPNYRYLISDYNGLSHYGVDDKKINIDFLVPSVNVEYLWKKVHSAYGFTYSGALFDNVKFKNLWITYPKSLSLENSTEVLDTTSSRYIDYRNNSTGNDEYYYTGLYAPDLVYTRNFIAPTKGSYKLFFTADVTFNANNPSTTVFYYASLNQDDLPFIGRVNPINLAVISNANTSISAERIIEMEAGDTLQFYAYYKMNGFLRWNTNYNIRIDQLDAGEVSFSDQLADFSITDFVKEIVNAHGLTAFPDEHSKDINYLLMSERVVTAETVDWSAKYVERTGESYVFSSYAQKNIFAYQYNDKEGSHNNGAIGISNLNLPESKVAFRSKMYSPEKPLFNFYLGTFGYKWLSTFKLYEKEVNDKNGITEVNYKGLDKRFHYARSQSISTSVVIGSKTFLDEETVSSLPLADFSDLTWTKMISTFYFQYGRILNDSRMHDITLKISEADMLLLDLKKLYYFEQEQQYYLINKMEFDGSETAKMEGIRVKRENDAIIPIDPEEPGDYEITVVWQDGTNAPKSGGSSAQIVKIAGMSYPGGDPLTSFEWEIDSGSGFVGIGSGANPQSIPLSVLGVNSIRLKGTSQAAAAHYSNVLTYEKIDIICKQYRYFRYGGMSGDDVTVSYLDCDGVEQTASAYGTGSPGDMEVYICASEILSGNGTANEIGDC